jgi:hypothetical protein
MAPVRPRFALPALVLAALVGCPRGPSPAPGPASTPERASARPASVPASAPADALSPDAAPLPAPEVEARRADARRRLADSEGGRLVWAAIEAHGGLGPWLSAGTIAFDFDYRPVGKPERRMHTRSEVDLWRARARQVELGEGADAELGWDGRHAWILPRADAFPSPARFWATTPYYFVGIPWVLADPGTRFERLPDLPLDGRATRVVKVGFEPGTGDSPDDYYVLHLDPDTGAVLALRYVVAYPGFFPAGAHSPEKLMRYSERRRIGGLDLAHRYDTFAWDAAASIPGPRVTEIVAARFELGRSIPADRFAPPDEAEVSTAIEARR